MESPTEAWADRPWWRQRWWIILGGFVLSAAVGIASAEWLERTGDWSHGAPWERRLLFAVVHPLPRWIDVILYVAPWSGTNISLIPIVAVAGIWLWAKRHRPHLALRLYVVQLGSYLLNPALKSLFDRPRPDLFERRGWYGWSSFPSGHAICSVAVLTTVALMLHRERGWIWPYFVFIPLAAADIYSRLYLGVHWPGDVFAGALVGLVWLVATAIAFREAGRVVPDRRSLR